jgi:hypothetical protein
LELEQLRVAAGLERKAAAAALGCAVSKIGHLETWRNLPSKSDLIVLLERYAASARLDDLWGRAQRAKQRGFWERHDGVVGAEGIDTYIGLEQGASELLSFEAMAVPGLLQTEDYARAVFNSWHPLSDTELAQRVDLRMRRQQVLRRRKPPKIHVVFEEGVLRRQVGGPKVQRDQLDHLADLARQGRVVLQVLLAEAGAHPGQHGPFTILRFPHAHDPGAVFIESRRRSLWLEEPEEIAEYGDVFDHLAHRATPPDQAQAVLARIKEELPQ